MVDGDEFESMEPDGAAPEEERQAWRTTMAVANDASSGVDDVGRHHRARIRGRRPRAARR